MSVSVVIPHFNSSATLGRALISISRQSKPPFEVIVVDDHSSRDELRRAQVIIDQDYRCSTRLVQTPVNRGPGSARNVGWSLARQPLIAFLDADDSWHPDKLKLQSDFMNANPQYAMVGHAYTVVAKSEPVSGFIPSFSARPVSPSQLLRRNMFATPTVMLRRNVSSRFGEVRHHSEDYLLWLRLVLDGHLLGYSSSALATLHKASYGDSGLSADSMQMARAEISNLWDLHREARLSRPRATFYSALSIAKSLRRLVHLASRRTGVLFRGQYCRRASP